MVLIAGVRPATVGFGREEDGPFLDGSVDDYVDDISDSGTCQLLSRPDGDLLLLTCTV